MWSLTKNIYLLRRLPLRRYKIADVERVGESPLAIGNPDTLHRGLRDHPQYHVAMTNVLSRATANDRCPPLPICIPIIAAPYFSSHILNTHSCVLPSSVYTHPCNICKLYQQPNTFLSTLYSSPATMSPQYPYAKYPTSAS